MLAGLWDDAATQIPELSLQEPNDTVAIKFLLGEQKYLELLALGSVEQALAVLRTELTPLRYLALQYSPA